MTILQKKANYNNQTSSTTQRYPALKLKSNDIHSSQVGLIKAVSLPVFKPAISQKIYVLGGLTTTGRSPPSFPLEAKHPKPVTNGNM
jgi:hypothetical protein